MRYLILALFLVTAIPSFAATPEALQETLRAQLNSVKSQSQGRLKTEGDIAVAAKGSDAEIIYPSMKVTVADGLSYWTVPSIRVTLQGFKNTDASVPLKLTLPETLQQVHNDGTVLRRVALAGQNIGGTWSQKENTVERLDAKIASITWTDVYADTTTTAQSIAAQTMTKFDGTDKVVMLLNVDTGRFDRQPSGFANSIMPKTLSATGQIKSLPKALAVLGTLMPLPGLQSLLAQNATQLTIDELNIVTNNGAQLKGDGWFKAAATGSQLPVSGRANLEWRNLQQVLNSLQKGMGQTTDKAQNAQSMLMIMMLQGMGTSVNNTTRYVVDLTPEGQILLNGKDVSGLFMGSSSMLKMFQPQPKAAVTPEASGAPIGGAMPAPIVKDEGDI